MISHNWPVIFEQIVSLAHWPQNFSGTSGTSEAAADPADPAAPRGLQDLRLGCQLLDQDQLGRDGLGTCRGIFHWWRVWARRGADWLLDGMSHSVVSIIIYDLIIYNYTYIYIYHVLSMIFQYIYMYIYIHIEIYIYIYTCDYILAYNYNIYIYICSKCIYMIL